MKKWIALTLAIVFLTAFAGCGQNNAEVKEPETAAILEASETELVVAEGRKALVVCFSCTGNTVPLAEYAADCLSADLYEIVPEVPYSSQDIAYNNDDCRANLEQADETCRPAIAGEPIDMDRYDTVILAFPIWWGKEPRILDTFLESYEFTGKNMAVFCTSGSSGVGTAERNLKSMAGDTVNWLGAERFASGTSKNTITDWLKQIGL